LTTKAVITKTAYVLAALKALQTAVVIERLSAQGYRIVGNTPREFQQLIATETERWKSVAKSAGIKPVEAGR